MKDPFGDLNDPDDIYDLDYIDAYQESELVDLKDKRIETTAEFEAFSKDSVRGLLNSKSKAGPAELSDSDISSIETYLSGVSRRAKEEAELDQEAESKSERVRTRRHETKYPDMDTSPKVDLTPPYLPSGDGYGKKFVIPAAVCLAVGLLILSFFVFKINSMSKEIALLNNQADLIAQYEAEIEKLTHEKTQLQTQALSSTAPVEEDAISKDNESDGTIDDNQNQDDAVIDANETPLSAPLETQQAETTTAKPPQGGVPGGSYTIIKGDTLWKISQNIYGDGKYYINIMEANGISDASSISAGQTIKLPLID